MMCRILKNSAALSHCFAWTAPWFCILLLVSSAAYAQVTETKLTGDDTFPSDRFGFSVSIDGDRMLVGSYQDDDAGESSGSAYIFRHDGSTWIQEAKITADDARLGDQFGWSVSLDGDLAIVGAIFDDVRLSGMLFTNSGSAYIFRREGTAWIQEARIIPADPATGVLFGYSVSISGNRAIVGTRFDAPAGFSSGSTYIFRREGTAWIQEAKIIPADLASGDSFGYSVSISGNRALIGARGDDDAGSGSGSAYIFRREGTAWIQEAKINAADAATLDRFGTSVSITGDRALVGTPGDDHAGSRSGSAYVFRRTGTTWSQETKLTASVATNNDQFGRSVSITGNRALIGASIHTFGGIEYGATHVFQRIGTAWVQEETLTPSDGDGDGSDFFGYSVSISGNRAVVGAYLSSAVYAFDLTTPQADLALDKIVDNAAPPLGQTVSFTVTLTNTGPNDADDIEVSDLLPAGLTFAGAATTQGGYNPGTGLWSIGSLADGATATLTLMATANTLDPATNTATITNASLPDPDPDNNTASATIIPQAADLALDKIVDNPAPALGQSAIFTIEVSHLDGADVAAVRVEDQIPDGTSYIGHITTQGGYDPGTGLWTVGALTEGQVETLTLTVMVNSTEAITNTAFIAFSNQPDPAPGNNRDAAALNAVAADLELTKSVTSLTRDDGVITATFAVTVTNEGPSNTDGVTVVDRLSPDMMLVGTTTSQGTVASASPVVTWDVGALAVGATATMTVTVTAPPEGNLRNTAEVTASSLPDPDSVPGDGEGDDTALATASTRPVPDFVPAAGPGGVLSRGNRYTADLALTKEVTVAGTARGQEATYTLAVVNLGPSPTAQVEVTDHLPACLDFVSATADKGGYAGAVWTIGKLIVGARVVLEIVARVTAACTGEVVNEAWISSSTLPDPPDPLALFEEPATVANNYAEARFTVGRGREAALDGSILGLERNYPNPFNPQTTIRFSLAKATAVKLVVYDVLGRQVRVLVDGSREAGLHEVTFEASDLPSGTYLVRLETPQGSFVQTMQLVK